tara:strand:+ start:159 stop:524 length:366 start_codon:yes stop_codon:yes gene_type:complete
MAWDDDKRQQAVDLYLAEEPTPENSMEVVKQVALELDESPNGVRMILTKANVYIKKEAASGGASSSGSSTSGGGRVSKAEQFERLKKAIEATGQEADMDIIEKISGKAAAYFAGVLEPNEE